MRKEANNLIRMVINQVMGVKPGEPSYAYEGRQNATRPQSSRSRGHCSVHLANISTVGTVSRKLTNNTDDPDLTQTLEQFRTFKFSVNFFKDSAHDSADKVKIRLFGDDQLYTIRQAGFALKDISEVRDLTTMLGQGWEDRAQIDIELNTVHTDETIIRSIQEVLLRGNVDGLDTSIDTRTNNQ